MVAVATTFANGKRCAATGRQVRDRRPSRDTVSLAGAVEFFFAFMRLPEIAAALVKYPGQPGYFMRDREGWRSVGDAARRRGA